MSKLDDGIISGLKWTSLEAILQPVLQIGFTVILARLLDVSDFGIIAMTMLFVDLMNAVFNIGIENALIHYQDSTKFEESALFIINIVLNLVLSVTTLLLAPLIATFFHDPRLVSVLRLMSVIFIFNALSFPRIIMRRSLLFSTLTRCRLSSMLFGNIVGLIFAFFGFAYWALALRLLTERGLFASSLWIFSDWRPEFRPRLGNVRRLIVFGGQIWGGNILAYFAKNLGKIIIARFLSAEALGYYSIAVSIAEKAPERAVSVVASVMAPAFAKLQSNKEHLKDYFTASVTRLFATFLPALTGLYFISTDFVVRLYGHKWINVAPILKVVLIWGLFLSLEHLNRALLISQGKGKFTVISRFVELVFTISTLYVLVPKFNIMGVAYSLVLTSIALFCFSIVYIKKFLNASFISFGQNIARIVLAVLFMSILLMIMKIYIIHVNINIRLITYVIIGALSYLVSLRFIGPEFVRADFRHIKKFKLHK